jgi:hypothetical protein
LALQSSDPGASFIELARVFRKRRLGEADATTFGLVEADTSSTFSGRARDIITRMLATEFDRFAARGGPVGKAVASLGEISDNCDEPVRNELARSSAIKAAYLVAPQDLPSV